jgi:hypothetical protein
MTILKRILKIERGKIGQREDSNECTNNSAGSVKGKEFIVKLTGCEVSKPGPAPWS